MLWVVSPLALMLQTLVEEGLISEHVFYHIPESTSDMQASHQVALKHLQGAQHNQWFTSNS